MERISSKDCQMAKSGGKKKMEPAKILSFSYKKYPIVLEAANKLADATERNPHNAMNQAAKAISQFPQEFIKFCREHGANI